VEKLTSLPLDDVKRGYAANDLQHAIDAAKPVNRDSARLMGDALMADRSHHRHLSDVVQTIVEQGPYMDQIKIARVRQRLASGENLVCPKAIADKLLGYPAD